MKASTRNRLLVVLVIVLAAGVAAAVAYYVGFNGGQPGALAFGPFGRMGRGYMMGGGYGGFGLLGPLILAGLFVGLVVLLLSGTRGSAQRPPAGPDAVEKLKQLAELHAGGALTDEEFAAAKKRLLDL